MATQTRSSALQEEYVRLYCTFERDGRLADPIYQPMVQIVRNSYQQESSSSSGDSASSESSSGEESSSSMTESSSLSTERTSGVGWGPFFAQREHIGIWYLDWFVPAGADLGDYFDMWTFRWDDSRGYEKLTLKFTVYTKDEFLNFSGKELALATTDGVVEMVMQMRLNLLQEVQNIPMYWEQGYKVDNNRLNFAFGNWNTYPKPQLMKNQSLIQTGWIADMNGHITVEGGFDPEDQFYAHYYFRYFSDEEIISFLNEGLFSMNATPPASQYAHNLANMPFEWRFGVTLYACVQALRRLLMGLTMQEKALIWAERPEDRQPPVQIYQQLYKDYQELWLEVRKDIKSRRLPGIAVYVTPEYTLPGGRSRWFRYLYK